MRARRRIEPNARDGSENMTEFQKLDAKRRKLNRERREKRIKLAELAALDTRTDEQDTELSELQTFMLDNDKELLIVDDAINAIPREERVDTFAARGEHAEFAALVGGTTVVDFLDPITQGRAPDGRAAELQQHFKLATHVLPVECLMAPTRRDANGELHTFAVSTLPDRSATEALQTDQEPWLTPVFANGDAAFIGAYQPVVESGDAVVPVVETRPTVSGPHDDSTDVDNTTMTMGADAQSPGRIQASILYRRTDALRAPGMEDAFRATLSDGLSEANDVQIMAALASADVARVAAAANVETFASWASRYVFDEVDGRYAATPSDIRLLIGTATLANMGALYPASGGADSAYENVRDISGGVRVSPHMAAPQGGNQDVIVRKGMRRDLFAPIWRGVEIEVDRTTGRAKGEYEVFATMFGAWKVVRGAGFARKAAHLS